MLSIPAILGANILEILELEGDLFAEVGVSACLAGMVAAAVSGIFAIKILNYFAVKKNFSVFAVYCFLVGGAAIIGDLFIKKA